MNKRFPNVIAHSAASCFNCEGDLDGAHWHKSDLPPGRGAYFQYCAKCGLKTYYDLSSELPISDLLQTLGLGHRPAKDGAGEREVYDLATGTRFADMTAAEAVEYLKSQGVLPWEPKQPAVPNVA